MLTVSLFAAMLQTAPVPPVPGGCTAPAAENVGKPGCFLSTEVQIASAPASLYWHIREFPGDAKGLAAARAEVLGRDDATVVSAHGKTWLYILSPRAHEPSAGRARAAIGPFALARDKPVTARFMESLFPAGMRTRVHTHSGPEAFFVVKGVQCVETPSAQRRIGPGESFIVEGGPHLQASAEGRESLVLILAQPGAPWMTLDDWSATGFCDR